MIFTLNLIKRLNLRSYCGNAFAEDCGILLPPPPQPPMNHFEFLFFFFSQLPLLNENTISDNGFNAITLHFTSDINLL